MPKTDCMILADSCKVLLPLIKRIRNVLFQLYASFQISDDLLNYL